MKVTARASDLKAGIRRVIGTIDTRGTIPILSHVLLTAKGQSLTIVSTNLDMTTETQVVAEVADEGQFVVHAKTLEQITSRLPQDGMATFETDKKEKDRIDLKCGRSRFKLNTLPAEDFPSLGPNEKATSFDLTREQVDDLFERTQFAISKEETRYYLNGVFLHPKGKKLRGVSTDGHRLARVECAMPEGAKDVNSRANQEIPGVIIPRQTVEEITGLIDGVDKVSVQVSPSRITVSNPVTTLTSKLIDGTFPDYARVIPTGNAKVCTVDKVELQDALARVSAVSSDKGRAVKLTLTPGKLELSLRNADVGTADEEVEVEWTADNFEVGFNARYLLDILDEVKSETVEVKLFDPGSPTLIQGQDDKDGLFVLMPMRV